MEAVPSTKPAAQPVIENESFWMRHAELHKESGLTRKDYCRLHNINYVKFGYWLCKLKLRQQPSSLVSVKLKSSEEAFPQQSTLCTLNFSNGCSLKIHDTQALSVILERMR